MLSSLPIIQRQRQFSKLTEDLTFCKKQIISLREEFTLFKKTTENHLELICQLLSNKSSATPEKPKKKPLQRFIEDQWEEEEKEGNRRRNRQRNKRRNRRRNKRRSVSDTILGTGYGDDLIIRDRSYSISEEIIPNISNNSICLVCGISMKFCEKCQIHFCKNHQHICQDRK